MRNTEKNVTVDLRVRWTHFHICAVLARWIWMGVFFYLFFFFFSIHFVVLQNQTNDNHFSLVCSLGSDRCFRDCHHLTLIISALRRLCVHVSALTDRTNGPLSLFIRFVCIFFKHFTIENKTRWKNKFL